jgi:hypothetical protein
MENEKTPKKKLLEQQWNIARKKYRETFLQVRSPSKSVVYEISDTASGNYYYNFTHLSQLIDISDLDEKINSLTDEEITDDNIWKILAPRWNNDETTKKRVERTIKKIKEGRVPKEYWIADQVANTILARSLILQNRLYEGKDEKYEVRMSFVAEILLKCPGLEPAKKEWKNRTQEQVDHYTAKNLELYNKIKNGDQELINRIKDLPWIILPKIETKEPETEIKEISPISSPEQSDGEAAQSEPTPKTPEPEKEQEIIFTSQTKPQPEQEWDFLKKINAYSKIDKTDEPITEGGTGTKDTAEPEPETENSTDDTDTETELTEKQEIEKRAAKEKAKIERKNQAIAKQKQEAEQDREQKLLAKPTITWQDLEQFKHDYQTKRTKEQEKNDKLSNWIKKENDEFFKGKQPKETNQKPSPITTTSLSTYTEPEKRKPLKFIKYKKPEPEEPKAEPQPEIPEPQTPSQNNQQGENNQQNNQDLTTTGNFSFSKKAAWVGTIGVGSCLFFAAGLISVPLLITGLFFAAIPIIVEKVAPALLNPIQNLIIIIIALYILVKIIKKFFKKKDND